MSEERLARIEATLTDLRVMLAELVADRQRHDDRHAEARGRMDGIDSRLSGHSDRLNRLEDDIAKAKGWVAGAVAAGGGLGAAGGAWLAQWLGG